MRKHYKIVVAKSAQEFWAHISILVPNPKKVIKSRNEVHDQNGNIYLYCSDAEKLRGLRNWKPIFVGNGHLRNDVDLILDLHKMVC